MKMGANDEVSVQPQGPKIPAFEDGKDDIDSYLRRFESYVAPAPTFQTQKWPNSASTLVSVYHSEFRLTPKKD